MNTGASLRETSIDDSDQTMDEIMATIREIISRDDSPTDDSDDYAVLVSPSNSNSNIVNNDNETLNETLLLEMEDQLRAEVTDDLDSRVSVSRHSSPRLPDVSSLDAFGGPSLITSESVASALLLRHSDDVRVFLEELLTPLARRWLSENLPLLAERLVRSEIERVSSELNRTAS